MISWILLCLFVAASADGTDEIKSQRILYGTPAKIEDYPYYAGLANCGAAILSNDWILTAAHCVEKISPWSRNYVWVGGESFANSVKVPMNRVIVHPQYQSVGIPIHDVALIKLAEPLQFSKKVKSIKLPSAQATSPNVVFVGRGRDETGTIPKNLGMLELIRLTSEQCLSLLPKNLPYYNSIKQNIKYLEKSIICAKRQKDMPTICDGDSGSPLVSGDSVIGLASFGGAQHCSKNRLGFYVNVASYVPWIKEQTGL